MNLPHILPHKRGRMNTYIVTRGNTYYYRRRIPAILKPHMNVESYYKALSPNMKVAELLASKITETFARAIVMCQLGLPPVLKELINDRDGRKMEEQHPPLLSLSTAYLKTLSVRKEKLQTYTMMLNVMNVLLPEINQESLDLLREKLQKLPKRTIKKYRQLPVDTLITLDIKDEEKLSNKSINEYLKILNATLAFAFKRGKVSQLYKMTLLPIEHSARTERDVLNMDEIRGLIAGAKTSELALSFELLYLSGMRLSEAYKCQLSTIDGVECFDLRDTIEPLKNNSSYRLIPVYSSIRSAERSLKALRSLRQQNISKQASKSLSGSKKTLYSLRHTFATNMAAKEVEASVISELMGHSHKSITLNRYTKGYPVKILQNAIEKLPYT